MSEEKRYRIFTKAPEQVKLEDHGIKSDDADEEPARVRTLVEGTLSQAEYQKMFGDAANIIHCMYMESYDSNNYTIRIFATDVLACENHVKSHQGELINHLRDTEGMEPLEGKDIDRAARSYDDLTPEALQILLNAAEREIDPFTMDMDRAVREMEEAGLNLTDFVRAA